MRRHCLIRAGAFLGLASALAGILSCASSPPPKPPPPDDPFLADLTAWLKLDPGQQEKTSQLLKELAERNARIRQSWSAGARMHPEELLASRAVFEKDFVAILTEEQRRAYMDLKLKLQMKGRRPPGSR